MSGDPPRVAISEEEVSALLEKNAAGKWWVSVVTLRPAVQFSGELQPSAQQIEDMHHAAHLECYIANSVSTQVRIEPVSAPAA